MGLSVSTTRSLFKGIKPTEYFVDATNGNDANDGRSPSRPWQTVAKVNASTFRAGDRVRFRRGETWREQLTVPSSGDTGNPITFWAYGSGNRPIINGADIITGWTSYSGNTWQSAVTTEPLQVFMDDVRLTEGADRDSLNDHEWVWTVNVLYIRDDTGDPDVTGVIIEAHQRDRSIVADGISHMRMQNLHLTKGEQGFSSYSIGGATSVHFRHCEISWCRRFGIYQSGTVDFRLINVESHHHLAEHGLYISGYLNAADGLIVNECSFHDNGEAGIQIHPGTGGNRVTNAIFKHLLIYDNADVGLNDQCTSNAYWENCIFHNNGSDGGSGNVQLASRAGEPTLGVIGAVFYHCTFYDHEINCLCCFRMIQNAVSATIRNCIMDTDADGYFIHLPDVGPSLDSDYNLFYAAGGYNTKWQWQGVDKNSLAEWQVASSEDANSTTGDPDFDNATGDDFHIGALSAALGIGETGLGVAFDYDGVARGSPPDVGAYEYVA